jgi:hypothetical protein
MTALVYDIFVLLCSLLWFSGYYGESYRWCLYIYIFITPICLLTVHTLQSSYLDLGHMRDGSHPIQYILKHIVADTRAKEAYVVLFHRFNSLSSLLVWSRYITFLGFCFVAGVLFHRSMYVTMILLLLVEFYKLNVWELRRKIKAMYKEEDPLWLLDKKT